MPCPEPTKNSRTPQHLNSQFPIQKSSRGNLPLEATLGPGPSRFLVQCPSTSRTAAAHPRASPTVAKIRAALRPLRPWCTPLQMKKPMMIMNHDDDDVFWEGARDSLGNATTTITTPSLSEIEANFKRLPTLGLAKVCHM